MGLLNLALGQLLGIFLPIAGLLVALYFYDRSRRRVLVSTLRFWPRRPAPAVRQRHKRIQHPLSLLLQLIALLLLLLAIADPRPDIAGASGGHRVILLDTSAAMALATEDGTLLMEEAKALALSYLGRLPAADRVLLIEADGAPTIRVPFTEDRQRLQEAILEAEPGWSALDLQAAFDLAEGTLQLALDPGSSVAPETSRSAEAVYVGPGRQGRNAVRAGTLAHIRFLETGAPADSYGLVALRASADASTAGKWDVELAVRNYTDNESRVRIDFLFDGKQLGHRDLAMQPGADSALQFTLTTRRPGLLTARTATSDAFHGNNQAEIAIPAVRRTRLQVIGGSEGAFEPLLAAGVRVEASFVDSGAELSEDAIHVWARGSEENGSRRAIYLLPPGTPSPLGEAGSVRNLPVEEWSASHPLALGVRDPDLTPERARVFAPAMSDEVVASNSEGPVIVARSTGNRRMVAFGFDLASGSVRNRLAAPLLFANAIAWLDAGAFRAESVEARTPGTVEIKAPNASRERISVRTGEDETVPWVLAGDSIRFYAGRKGTYRVTADNRYMTFFVNQPDVPLNAWTPPDGVEVGLPSRASNARKPWLPWPWLASVAALILLFDWIRFGRGRRLTRDPLQTTGLGSGEGA